MQMRRTYHNGRGRNHIHLMRDLAVVGRNPKEHRTQEARWAYQQRLRDIDEIDIDGNVEVVPDQVKSTTAR